MPDVLMKRELRWEENILLWQRQRLERLQGKEHQGLPVNHEQLRKGKDGFSPLGFGGDLGLLKPRFQTSNLQNLKNHFLLFYATSLQYFALRSWCTVHPALSTGTWQAATMGFLSHLVQFGQNKELAGNSRAVGKSGQIFIPPVPFC